eukprot:7016600-Ditylum_brightwellii.AAC.1
MAHGLGVDTEKSGSSSNDDDLLQNLQREHTSYLQINYYPPCPLGKEDEKKEDNPPPLGNENKNETKWFTMKPVP